MSDELVIEGKTKAKGQQGQKLDAKAATAEPGDKVWIQIPKTETDKRDVFVSVNFVSYLLKRGVPIEVPRAVVNALQDAVGVQYMKETDPISGRETLVPQEVLSYPFQFVQAPKAK